MIRIAFLTSLDANDKRSWSGTYYYMAKAIERHIGEVVYLGPVNSVLFKIFAKTLSILKRFFSFNKYRQSHSLILSYYFSRFFRKKLAENNIDLIFAPAASTEIALLKTDIPIVYLSDTTFDQIRDYYPKFSNLSSISNYEGDKIERLAISNADITMYPTQWAADSAIHKYSASPSKIRVIPFGANIDQDPSVKHIGKRLKHTKCTLLFLAKEWERKGGPLAVATFKRLQKKGLDIELIVCGTVVPEQYMTDGISQTPFLNKNDPAEYKQFQALFDKTDYLFLPTRAECYGMVFCEASAYGIPSITTATGGVTGVVTDGVNGFALDENATAEDYADLIYNNFTNDAVYSSLVHSARKQYDESLNWDVWAIQFKKVVNGVI